MAEYRWCVEEMPAAMPVASGSAPTEAEASREMMHYALQYSQDGAVRFWMRHNRETVAEGALECMRRKFSIGPSA